MSHHLMKNIGFQKIKFVTLNGFNMEMLYHGWLLNVLKKAVIDNATSFDEDHWILKDQI